jgi:uncharacterized paraquat-inducible protein A
MPATSHKRERMSRFRLRNIAADACRYIEMTDGHAELDCPRCAHTLRTRHTGEHVTREGGPLWSALLDHLFHDCSAVEHTR